MNKFNDYPNWGQIEKHLRDHGVIADSINVSPTESFCYIKVTVKDTTVHVNIPKYGGEFQSPLDYILETVRGNL